MEHTCHSFPDPWSWTAIDKKCVLQTRILEMLLHKLVESFLIVWAIINHRLFDWKALCLLSWLPTT